jgi:hypothetical protein
MQPAGDSHISGTGDQSVRVIIFVINSEISQEYLAPDPQLPVHTYLEQRSPFIVLIFFFQTY